MNKFLEWCLLVAIMAGVLQISGACKPKVVYIPGDNETSKVVYFIKEGDPSPIDGIVISKAKFYRLCKRAKTDTVERDILEIVPVGGDNNGN